MKKIFFLVALFLGNLYASPRTNLSEPTKKEILKVFSAYEKLFSSYFEYNPAEAEKNSKTFLTILAKSKDKNFQEITKNMKAPLEKIKTSMDRKSNNLHFFALSREIVEILKTYEIPGYSIYYCPMVKMKWIQNSKKMPELNNPYAPEMPHCGEKESSF
jgi:hypothetical protein